MSGPPDEYYVPLDERRVMLFVRECGVGADPVVVLHGGWGAEHGYLLGLVRPHFDECRFVLYDQRGSLRSPAAVETISVAQHVADLERLRVELGLGTMRILAHSMGTFLAMSYLQAHPDRVRELVLVGAIPAHFDGDVPLDRFLQGSSEALLARPEVQRQVELLRLPATPTARQQTQAWRLQFAAVNLHHVERWRQMPGGQAYYSSDAGRAAAKSMPDRWDFRALLRAHPHPVHVLFGASDFLDRDGARWRAIAAQCPELHLHVVPEAGHAAWIDQPDEIARLLRLALGGATALAPGSASADDPPAGEPGREPGRPLAFLDPLLGQWSPAERPDLVVHDYAAGIGPFSLALRESYAPGHPEQAALQGVLFHDPVDGSVRFVAVAGPAPGQGRVFRGGYRALDDGRIERTYEVRYRTPADTPGEELGGLTRRFREVYAVDGDRLAATLEWWLDGAWRPFARGRYELRRRAD